MLNFKGIAGAAVIGLALASQGAFASNDIDATLNGFEYSGKTNAVTVDWSLNGSAWSKAYAGAFSGTFDLNSESFVSFCVEVTQKAAGWGVSASYTEASFSSAIASNLTNLANKYYLSVSDSLTSAAFQLAVWEIVLEDGTLDLTNGAFKVKNSAGAINLAQSWLNGINDDSVAATGDYSLRYLQNGKYQDMLVLTPVPEPATYGMLLLGMGLVGLFARRRSTPTIRA